MRNRSFRPGLEVLGVRINPSQVAPLPVTPMVATSNGSDTGMDFSGQIPTEVPFITDPTGYPHDVSHDPIIFCS